MYFKETGFLKRIHEFELLEEQFSGKVDLFGCKPHLVYSDCDADCSGDMKRIKVNDVEDDFHAVKGKIQQTWVNI